jgi:spermidine synthase
VVSNEWKAGALVAGGSAWWGVLGLWCRVVGNEWGRMGAVGAFGEDGGSAAAELVTLARADTPHGEVSLRRRGEVLELVVGGVFAMDTVDVSTEVELARAALADHPDPRRVLVGGLGLGFTARAVLADDRVERLDVVELAAPLVEWGRTETVPELSGLDADGRCRLYAADVADVLTGTTAAPSPPWDLVLLDVDNGPGFLVHPHNAGLYAPSGLHAAYRALAPSGRLVIWSSHEAPDLATALRALAADHPGASADERVITVPREGRDFDYALYGLSAGTPPRA